VCLFNSRHEVRSGVGQELVFGRVREKAMLIGYSPAELLGQPILNFVDQANLGDLRDAFEEAQSGDDGASRAVAAELLGTGRLTTREAEIVRLLVAGDRVPSIAQRLFLSQSTVRSHLSVIFCKFGVRSQSELLDLLRARHRESTGGDRS